MNDKNYRMTKVVRRKALDYFCGIAADDFEDESAVEKRGTV